MEGGREGGRNEDACYVRQGQHVRKYFFFEARHVTRGSRLYARPRDRPQEKDEMTTR